ncbi:MAG: hypothetical protein AAB492_04605 [Patescibacteria group bacterium]
MQRFSSFFILLTLFLLVAPVTHGKFNPTDVPNNKYGIHIVEPNDIMEVSTLVNSSGGDWGYVTLVIQEDDRNKEKWQAIFNTMRRMHLIPIVRLATKIEADAWKKPTEESAKDWASFLNSLHWPIENRYVVLFNEPNHANEWGKTIDPSSYARIATTFADALHEASEDYFVLPAGLDVSASSDGRSLDAASYLKQMYQAKPELFELLDGWTSHSYPNPGFSGSAFASGRSTVRSYAWEREYLRSLGINKSYPIFITETGWVHTFGVTNNFGLLSPEAVGQALQQAANVSWADKDIVAITPFIFNYQGLPFDHFSWKKLGSNGYYPHYYSYQSIEKLKGQPYQRESYTLEHPLIPEKLVTNSSVTLTTKITNNGQSIISHADGYTIKLDGLHGFTVVTDALSTIEPNESGEIRMHLQLPSTEESYAYTVNLSHGGRNVALQKGTVTLIPPPSLTLRITLGWKRVSDSNDATLLLYDNDELIHKIHGVPIKNGVALISNLTNVIPNATYRVVVLVPTYLPRQTIAPIAAQNSTLTIPRMYPFDFDTDGAFTIADLWTMFTMAPRDILNLFITI